MDSRSESLVSVASLNWASPDALVALVGRGLVTHLRGSHRGSVPVLVSPPRHMARQGTHGAGSGGGRGRGWSPLSRSDGGHSEGCSSSVKTYPVHAGILLVAASCLETPWGKKTPLKQPPEPQPPQQPPRPGGAPRCGPATLLARCSLIRNQLVLGYALRGFAF